MQEQPPLHKYNLMVDMATVLFTTPMHRSIPRLNTPPRATATLTKSLMGTIISTRLNRHRPVIPIRGVQLVSGRTKLPGGVLTCNTARLSSPTSRLSKSLPMQFVKELTKCRVLQILMVSFSLRNFQVSPSKFKAHLLVL